MGTWRVIGLTLVLCSVLAGAQVVQSQPAQGAPASSTQGGADRLQQVAPDAVDAKAVERIVWALRERYPAPLENPRTRVLVQQAVQGALAIGDKRVGFELEHGDTAPAERSLLQLTQSAGAAAAQAAMHRAVFLELRKPKAALGAYRQASRLDPQAVAPFRRIGDLQRAARKWLPAKRAYKRALSLASQDPRQQAELSVLLGELHAEKSTLAGEARRYFEQALALYEQLGDEAQMKRVRALRDKLAPK